MKKLTFFLVGVALVIATAQAQTTVVKVTEVIGNGGSDAFDVNHTMHLQGTVGQGVIGSVGNSSGDVGQGFWHQVTGKVTGVKISQVGPPADFTLDQNYPNPFNPATLIKFSVPHNTHVVLNIYSLTGSLVKTLVDNDLSAGVYSVNFTAEGLTTGTFLYTLEAGGRTLTKRMVLIK